MGPPTYLSYRSSDQFSNCQGAHSLKDTISLFGRCVESAQILCISKPLLLCYNIHMLTDLCGLKAYFSCKDLLGSVHNRGVVTVLVLPSTVLALNTRQKVLFYIMPVYTIMQQWCVLKKCMKCSIFSSQHGATQSMTLQHAAAKYLLLSCLVLRVTFNQRFLIFTKGLWCAAARSFYVRPGLRPNWVLDRLEMLSL